MGCTKEKNKLLWQNKCAPLSRHLPYSTEWYNYWMGAHGRSKGWGETQPLTSLYLLLYITAHLHHRHNKLKTRNRHSAVFAQSHTLYSKHFCTSVLQTLFYFYLLIYTLITYLFKKMTNKQKSQTTKKKMELFMPGAQIWWSNSEQAKWDPQYN